MDSELSRRQPTSAATSTGGRATNGSSSGGAAQGGPGPRRRAPPPRAAANAAATAGDGPAEDEGPNQEEEGDDDVDEEEEEGGEAGDGKGVVRNTLSSIEWDEVLTNPLEVHFTQDKIHPFFHRRGPIVNVLPRIRPVLRSGGDDEEATIELMPPFPPIHCLKNGEDLWTLDNRRLYALQSVAMEHWPQRCRVRVLVRDSLPRQRFRTQYRKFNTTSEGREIAVCARYQQFDTWSWFDRAVEYEWYTFSQRLGWLLSSFEILPVIGVLLFRTGLTGFSSRLPLVLGFILTFACDFLRQKVPFIEKRLCELHVQAVMDGEVRALCLCARRHANTLQMKLAGIEESQVGGPLSTPQLAAILALLLLLVLPYILGTGSLLSCWLGIACVLAVQIGSALSRGAAGLPKLSPKNVSCTGPDVARATSGLSARSGEAEEEEPEEEAGEAEAAGDE